MPNRNDTRLNRRKEMFTPSIRYETFFKLACEVISAQAAEFGFYRFPTPSRDSHGRLLRWRDQEGRMHRGVFVQHEVKHNLRPKELVKLYRAAFHLGGDDPFCDALSTAFHELKLDPDDPLSWRLLASLFAYIEFGRRPRRKASAPKKWDEKRLELLSAEVEHLKEKKPNITDKEIAHLLYLDPRFGAKSSIGAGGREGIRRAIRKARTDRLGRNRHLF